jgi:hypothetical protein
VEPAEALDQGWSLWWRFLGREMPGADRLRDPAECERIRRRLIRFSPEHPADGFWIDAVLTALARARYLVAAAVRWSRPSAGEKSEGATDTDRARGQQWRLVMGYGGLETLVKAVMAVQRAGRIDAEVADGFLAVCRPGDYEPIPAPSFRKELLDEIFRVPPDDVGHPLLLFLDLNPSNAKVMYRWLVEDRPVDTWARALKLAKALRDATAHGALSASKVKEWKLRPALDRLTLDLGRLAALALRRLADP